MGRERSFCSPMKDIAVEYLGGSGFLVAIGETALLFDASEHGPDRRSLPDKETPNDTGRSNMGIGLSVCRTIIKAHGSDIAAENLPGGGARFSFALEMEETENV